MQFIILIIKSEFLLNRKNLNHYILRNYQRYFGPVIIIPKNIKLKKILIKNFRIYKFTIKPC